MSTHPVEILISKILIKPEYYPRFQTDPERIKEFVEIMECGGTFPPVKLAKDEATGFYVLLDGKHRIEAYKLRGVDKIFAFILPVKKEHWLMTAARFNSKSSKPLTPEEIKQIIIQSWENGIKDTDEIAREMGCTVRYIEKILKPIRDEERNKREEKILELRQQGKAQRAIASEVGLALSAINKTLKSHDDAKSETSPESNEVFSGMHSAFHEPNDENFNSNLAHPGNDEDDNNDFFNEQIKHSQEPHVEKPDNTLVFSKRTQFVLRTLGETDKNNLLNNSTEESGSDVASPTPISTLPLNDKTESDTGQIEHIIKESKEFCEDGKNDPPQISDPQGSDNILNTDLCQKSNRLISGVPDKSYDSEKEKTIGLQKILPEKQKSNGDNFPTATPIEKNPILGVANSPALPAQEEKYTPYPSYLDQIAFYREIPVQGQQVMRAMELAKKYKLDIIDIVDEINKPPQWIKKVLVAAIALSLMNGKKLDNASRVETLLRIDFNIARYIQNALPFHRMLCPIAPEMEHWFKDNLTATDLDLIAALSKADKRDLPYFLKGETPPPKTPCFKQLPGSYKEHFQTSAGVLNEIREHARNKMFNHDSAKELLIHLNINQTAMNEIFDALREGIML
jgi:hypothetical protein